MAMAVLAVLVAMGLPENAQNSASVSVRSYYMSAILKMPRLRPQMSIGSGSY